MASPTNLDIIIVVAALITLLYSNRQGDDKTNMTQENGSTNYQAKGDITVNTKE